MNLIELFKLQSKLTNVKRYSTSFSIHPENTLEHTGSVAIICLALATEFNDRYPENALDIGVLLTKALLHDIEEAETGDIIRKIKYYNDGITDKIKECEADAAEKLILSLDSYGSANLYNSWKQSKDGVEGLVVKVADLIAVAYKIHQEITQYGNKSFIEVAKESLTYYEKFFSDLNEVNPHPIGLFLHDLLNESHKITRNLLC
jgi:5'-deoxynucleotidase YfbR-like HD superfamily hydrolase